MPKIPKPEVIELCETCKFVKVSVALGKKIEEGLCTRYNQPIRRMYVFLCLAHKIRNEIVYRVIAECPAYQKGDKK